jgi:uncharacterized protein YqjF (DUF2071 family)
VGGPDGKPGVWFFSLDAARMPAVIAARLAYGLPYAWSRMRVELAGRRRTYTSTRLWPNPRGRTLIEVEAAGPIEPGGLETFLTARFRLYSFRFGRLTSAEVDHPPWPLETARLIRAEQTLTAAAGLPDPASPPHVLFSPGVDVRVGAPGRV